jgi:quercetin dioxygenase-like cupin family protein
MTEQEWIEQLKNEGYEGITVHTFLPNQDMGHHTHEEAGVHVVLTGEFIVDEENGTITILKPGDRTEIAKGTTHSAKAGTAGCTFIAAIKK